MITLEIPGLEAPAQLEVRSDAENLPLLKGRILGPVIDLTNGIDDGRTVEHYSHQWGAAVGFQEFARCNSGRDGIDARPSIGLVRPVRTYTRARLRDPTRVYDAACGFGGIMDELFRDPVPEHLLYVGADIHGALGEIRLPKNARD